MNAVRDCEMNSACEFISESVRMRRERGRPGRSDLVLVNVVVSTSRVLYPYGLYVVFSLAIMAIYVIPKN